MLFEDYQIISIGGILCTVIVFLFGIIVRFSKREQGHLDECLREKAQLLDEIDKLKAQLIQAQERATQIELTLRSHEAMLNAFIDRARK